MTDFEKLKQEFRDAAANLKGKASVDQALLLMSGGLLFGILETLMEIKEAIKNGSANNRTTGN